MRFSLSSILVLSLFCGAHSLHLSQVVVEGEEKDREEDREEDMEEAEEEEAEGLDDEETSHVRKRKRGANSRDSNPSPKPIPTSSASIEKGKGRQADSLPADDTEPGNHADNSAEEDVKRKGASPAKKKTRMNLDDVKEWVFESKEYSQQEVQTLTRVLGSQRMLWANWIALIWYTFPFHFPFTVYIFHC